mgnify:CR=1 FL=1
MRLRAPAFAFAQSCACPQLCAMMSETNAWPILQFRPDAYFRNLDRRSLLVRHHPRLQKGHLLAVKFEHQLSQACSLFLRDYLDFKVRCLFRMLCNLTAKLRTSRPARVDLPFLCRFIEGAKKWVVES